MEIFWDVLLLVSLLWLAVWVLASPSPFASVVLFISFGLWLALAWVRLGAVDIALAEAAIGAGLTGALLLSSLGERGPRAADGSGEKEGEDEES